MSPKRIPVWLENRNIDLMLPYFSGRTVFAIRLAMRQIKHAGWLKVRQISLGYILPQNFVRQLGLSSIRVTAQLKNPFSIYDAAFWTDSDAGQSVNRGLVFGLNIGF